jgi:sucrose-6-phosphate hydrolase SacC (GH32 family)
LLYSARTKSRGDYRLGLAVSSDGVTWERRDHEVGIEPSGSGWDSDAIAYGSAVEHDGHVYLFYCGNERGKTGFGYAELESW